MSHQPALSLRPLSLAIALALFTPLASAAEQYQLEAGPLATQLNRFAAQAGILLAGDAALTSGQQSRALDGNYSVEQALSILLEGSGLEAVKTGDNRYELRPLPTALGLELAPTSISGQALGATTEGSNSYTTGSMSTATALSLSIKETPQSVSVVTRERMNDSGAATLQDAMNYTTGISVQSAGPQRDSYSARGFGVSNMMIDGLVFDYQYDAFASSGLEMFDRIEVVRGATGMMEGAGNPSASINLVRKRPTQNFQGSVTASAGSWSNYLGTLDLSGPLNDTKTVRGRFVTSYNDGDTAQSDTSRERQLFYGITELDLTPSTVLTVGGYYNKDKNPGAEYAGLPTKADGSFYDSDHSFRASPTWSYFNKQNTSAFAELEHVLDSGWKLSAKGAYLDGDTNILGAAPWNRDAADTFAYNAFQYQMDLKSRSFDVRATGPFDLLGREHELAIGANYRHESYTTSGGPGTLTYRFDPADWRDSVNGAQPTNWLLGRAGGYYSKLEREQYGAFSTAKINLADPLNVFIGGRVSWFEYENYIQSAAWIQDTAYRQKEVVTPYAAVTYDINRSHTIYGSMTDIFLPQNYAAAGGGLLDPVEGRNYEIGIKGEYFDRRMNTSLALFQINQTNLPDQLNSSQCPTLTISCYAAAGEVRSRGVELEVSGQVTDELHVFAGYTYVDAEYVEDSSAGKKGDRYGLSTPRNLFTLSGMYNFSGALEGWRLGASGRVQSRVENTRSGYATIHQPGYGVANLVAGYKPTEQLDFQLNVNNVFDRHYYRAVGSPIGSNMLGEPRNVVLAMNYDF